MGRGRMAELMVVHGGGCGRALRDAHLRREMAQTMGHSDCGGELFSGGLDGLDFDVVLLAGFVAADAGDPDLSAAEHGSLGVDEEVFVFLPLDDGGDGGGDDAVVVFDEGLGGADEGLTAVEGGPEGVGDEGGYGGGVMFSDGLLEGDHDLLELGVVAEHGVDGLVDVRGGGGLGGSGDEEEEKDGDQGEGLCSLDRSLDRLSGRSSDQGELLCIERRLFFVRCPLMR